MPMKRTLLLLGVLLAACSPAATTEPGPGGGESPPVAAPTVALPTVAPMVERATATATDFPTASAATAEPATLSPEATPEPPAPTPAAATAGRTDEGAFFYGSPDAPVTLIDYSDFL
jgi:hypothetical protein